MDEADLPNQAPKKGRAGPPPAPPHVIRLAREYVERATLTLKDFRTDLEALQSLGVAAMKDGQIRKEDAETILLDIGYVVSTPLVQRYLDAREFELVAKYLKHRIMYHRTGWLNERNRLALDGMIAGGEVALAVGLLREFLKKLYQHTQERWRAAGRKAPKGMTDPSLLEEIDRMREEALRELPGHLEIAALELAEIEVYLAEYGSREDNRALERFREELAKVRKRFGLGKDG